MPSRVDLKRTWVVNHLDHHHHWDFTLSDLGLTSDDFQCMHRYLHSEYWPVEWDHTHEEPADARRSAQ